MSSERTCEIRRRKARHRRQRQRILKANAIKIGLNVINTLDFDPSSEYYGVFRFDKPDYETKYKTFNIKVD